jgi:HAD superfamily 5'-nucleotidase-like hydrolase
MKKTVPAARVTAESRIPRTERIFVNRNLRLDSVGAIGFDLDHTLAHYRSAAIEELAYDHARRRLIDRFGYPAALLEVAYERDFVIRGLVVDKARGHVLKMDYHNYDSRAYCGRRQLTPAERKTCYRTGRVRMGSRSYISVDTLFHLPEVFLFAALVELRGSGALSEDVPLRQVYADVRTAIDSGQADGTLKTEILGDLPRFIRRNRDLGATLEEFRASGKKTFLLTNSELYYTRAVLGHLLNSGPGIEDWSRYFDLVVVEAGKPVYFTDLDRPPKDTPAEAPPGFAPVIHGGNARALETALEFSGDQILYFGDHTYGDILRSKKTLGWRTAMVVEELGQEIETTERIAVRIDELQHWTALRGALESDLAELRLREHKLNRKNGDGDTAARRRESIRARIASLTEELETVRATAAELGASVNRDYNPYWGPLFREGGETSRFGHQVKDFACLYTTRVSNFLHYPPNHYFRTAFERMPHELGD